MTQTLTQHDEPNYESTPDWAQPDYESAPDWDLDDSNDLLDWLHENRARVVEQMLRRSELRKAAELESATDFVIWMMDDALSLYESQSDADIEEDSFAH